MGLGQESDRDTFDPLVGDDVDRMLEALANPRRRRIYELLCERPRHLGELQRDLGEVSRPAITRHIQVLGWARLIWMISESFAYKRFQGDREQLYLLKRWVEKVEKLPFRMPLDDDGSPQAKRRQRGRRSGN